MLIFGLISGCAFVAPETSRRAMSWEELPGWTEDAHAKTLPVFLRSCEKLRGAWDAPCAAAKLLPENISDIAARRFFENHFSPVQLLNENGNDEGLITGYYEPLLEGAVARSETFRYPVYARPAGLLRVELGALYPELQNKRVRGRINNGAVAPYYSRAEIDGANAPLAGEELLWVDDKAALFFLHIQGSGLVRLRDGRIVGVGYQDQNGHPYRSIGRILIERGEMRREDVNLFSLKKWLRDNPHRAGNLLNENPSYVFFTRRDDINFGPRGSLGVPLTPERSLAADTKAVPPGAPVWLSTVMPDDGKTPLRRLMFAQDTGGAIAGNVRADFFWGRGARAEKMAGLMKTRGKLFILLPR
ncbi:MAG: murein transglycosylase A [Gammaproteobacteria bacterium]